MSEQFYTFDDLVKIEGATQAKVHQFIAQTKVSGFFDRESQTVPRAQRSGGRPKYVYSATFRNSFIDFVAKDEKTPWNMHEVVEQKPDDSLVALLKKHSPIELGELANLLNCSPSAAAQQCLRLQQRGYRIGLTQEEVTLERQLTFAPTFIAPSWGAGPRYKIGVISDTHYANRHAKLESVKAAYDYFEQQGCAFVIHGGDIVDGPPSFHKGYEYELCLHSLDEQMDFVRANHPTNLPTIFFGGNHDIGWHKQAGYSVAWNLCQDASKPWHFGGDIDGFVAGPDGNETCMYVLHPGGGSAHAISWKAQKVQEYLGQVMGTLTSSLKERGPKRMPLFTFMGHYHKRCYVPGIDEGHAFLIPSSCDVTSFQRQHHIVNHTGALMVEFGLDDNGEVDHLCSEWLRYPGGDEINYTKEFVRPKRIVNLW